MKSPTIRPMKATSLRVAGAEFAGPSIHQMIPSKENMDSDARTHGKERLCKGLSVSISVLDGAAFVAIFLSFFLRARDFWILASLMITAVTRLTIAVRSWIQADMH